MVQQPAARLYDRFAEGIKARIRTAQIRAVLAANAELVLHFSEIGSEILIDDLGSDSVTECPKL